MEYLFNGDHNNGIQYMQSSMNLCRRRLRTFLCLDLKNSVTKHVHAHVIYFVSFI